MSLLSDQYHATPSRVQTMYHLAMERLALAGSICDLPPNTASIRATTWDFYRGAAAFIDWNGNPSGDALLPWYTNPLAPELGPQFPAGADPYRSHFDFLTLMDTYPDWYARDFYRPPRRRWTGISLKLQNLPRE